MALHEQALRLVAMAQSEERGASPALREAAHRIGESRMRELDDLAAMMDTWGVPPHGSATEPLPGVMSAERLRRLAHRVQEAEEAQLQVLRRLSGR